MQAIQVVPFHRLSSETTEILRDVVENPSFYRRMPDQTIECDPQMFTFLVRRPEVMVNIWELMGITKVTAKRTNPFTFLADDGVGTTCKCDLIYGDSNLHIYYGTGNYDGSMTPRSIRGRCVCILRSQPVAPGQDSPKIAGTMDVFLKLDNFGADLLTRTFGPLVGKTADFNFVETAKFMSQISQICTMNPAAAQGLVSQLTGVDEVSRQQFASIAARIAANRATPLTLRNGAEPNDSTASVAVKRVDDEPLEFSDRGVSSRQSYGTTPTTMVELDLQPTPGTEAEFFPRLKTDIPLQATAELNLRNAPPSTITPRKNGIYMRR